MTTFKDQMNLDIAVFINPLEFGESVTYNGTALGADGKNFYAVLTVGMTDAKGNTIVTEGSSDRATFAFSKVQLPDWKPSDIIHHDSKDWYVLRCLSDTGAMITLECNSGESVF